MKARKRRWLKPIVIPALDARAIGLRCRRARKERGWSLEDLAFKTGLAYSTIASIECAARIPERDSAVAIAVALNRKLDWLLLGARKRSRPGRT